MAEWSQQLNAFLLMYGATVSIVRIKRLVAERVRSGGTLILNADDEHLVQLSAQERVAAVSKHIVYFSLDLHNPVIEEHLGDGGTAFVAAAGGVEERCGMEINRIAELDEIPATIAGTAEFQVYNVLAATAAARAYGLSPQHIRIALSEFRMEEHSRGRLNVFAFRGGCAVVDYGHNPAAIRAMQAMVSKWSASRRTAVIAIPGDRRTDLIVESARAVAYGYDRIYVREDQDLRGRQPGELAEILAETIRQENPGVALHIVPDELEATAAAFCSMMPEEIVVTFSDQFDAVAERLREHGAQAASEVQIQQLTRGTTAITTAA